MAMWPLVLALMACGVAAQPATAQPSSRGAQPGATAAAAPERAPEDLVRLWIERWNGLSETTESVDAFVALYDAAALHIAGPTRDQRGTATYRGHEGIRVMATRVAASELRRAYRVETETANETTAQLVHQTAGPWGGPAVAVQIVAVYTDAATQKRYATPGALFFQLGHGKIRRARVLLGDGERAEVESEAPRKRP